jgi:hypothetical protein
MYQSLNGERPQTVEYKKEENGFFTVFSFNKPKDEEPVPQWNSPHG